MVEHVFDAQNLTRFDFDVAGLSLVGSTQRLVDHDSAVGQGESFAFGSCSEKEGAHRSCQANADCYDITFDVFHCVVDRQASSD